MDSARKQKTHEQNPLQKPFQAMIIMFFITVSIFSVLLQVDAKAADNQADTKPFFSDDEWSNMRKSYPLEYRLLEKDGIIVPRINGRGLMGFNAGFSNADWRQAQYEAPILAQQGINQLKLGLRPEGYGWADWVKVQRIFEQTGISTMWSAYALCYEDHYYSRFLELPDRTLLHTDEVSFEDGKKGYFRGMGTLGNIFASEFVDNSFRVVDQVKRYLHPFPSVIGFLYTNEVNFATGSYDSEARASWQGFLKMLFKDRTPAEDTNRDGVFFNKTFGMSYKSWQEVEQFRGDDWKDRRKALLRDAWLGLRYAHYVDQLAERTRKERPELLTGAMICVPLSPSVDLSLMLSMPSVNASFINTYFCWLGNGLLSEAIADTYRKPSIASEINMPEGDYEAVKWGALTHLPYLEGFQWFTYSWLPKEAPGEHGGKYGFVDKWTINALEDKSESFTEPYKPVKYNSRFGIVPQIAPFVGRLHANHNRKILWVSAGGYPRDWQEDHSESNIMRANVTSDVALALAPKPLDLAGYKVIIYRNLQSPCISRDIYRRLQKFVKDGGTVITGGYAIAADGTWLGEDNKRDWWQGMKLARAAQDPEGSTSVSFKNHTISIKGSFPYLVPTSPAVKEAGEVQDSKGNKYAFLLTRNEGRGQWIYINVPYFFQMTEPFENFTPEGYLKRFNCLRDIVHEYSGEMPADRYGTQWYTGDDCVLAIREKAPGGLNAGAGLNPGTVWQAGKFVMFETFSLQNEDGKPFIEAVNRRLPIKQDLKPGEAKLWVVRPYGKPVVLYADGTLKNQARIDPGMFADNKLKFSFAERAFISSPSKPEAVTVNGKEQVYTYDETTKLLKIERSGQLAEAVIVYTGEVQ